MTRRAENRDDAGEKALIERCMAGESDAWNALLKRYEKPVFKYAYALSHSREDANDIAGQTFLRLYSYLNTFHSECCFSSWLFRIVRNTYVDMCLRSKHRTNVSLDSLIAPNPGSLNVVEIVDASPGPETLCISKEIVAILSREVRYLPAPQREVVRLFYSQGKSYDAIAASTGLSIGTVKSRLNRARAALRDRLSPIQDTLTARW